MDEQKSIPAMLEEIANIMCEDYCKWPEHYLSQYKDPEEASEVMIAEKCDTCPMCRMMT